MLGKPMASFTSLYSQYCNIFEGPDKQKFALDVFRFLLEEREELLEKEKKSRNLPVGYHGTRALPSPYGSAGDIHDLHLY